MRVQNLSAVLAAVAALASCGENHATSDPPASVPTTVSCGDAQKLRQQAADIRRRADTLTSDQEKINAGNRARFFASLAIVAALKCHVVLADADDALKPALEMARTAEATRSFYERTIRWGEADFMATLVSARLIQQLPAPPAK
jgi:hypothetical protein